MEPVSSQGKSGSRVELPPAEEVAGAYREKKAFRSSAVKQAQQYARQELAGGKKVEVVRDEMMRAGYPQPVAETVMWSGFLAAKRGRSIDQGLVALGVALLLILSSLWTGVTFHIPVQLGGAASVCLIAFGCVRLVAGSRIPNFSASFRQVTGIGKPAGPRS